MSVGGSIVIPKTGFDIEFLRQFREFLEERIREGERFILVIGGGGTARSYQQAARSVRPDLSEEDLDWIGIHATVLNARFVQRLFGSLAHSEIITDPQVRIESDRPIIMAAGWKPGRSTDNTAVVMAGTYGVRELLNLSNISCVYDKDPNRYDDAKRIDRISWQRFRDEIVGFKWQPGRSVPFDPIASGVAAELNLRVSILDGTNLSEVGKALSGEPFDGTVIVNE